MSAAVTASYTPSFSADSVSISGTGFTASTIYNLQLLAPGVSTTATVSPAGQAYFPGGSVIETTVKTDGAGAFGPVVIPISQGPGAGTYNVAVRQPSNAIAAAATTTFAATTEI